jgi:glycerol-3-phosphate acyltransferase PlsY
MSTAAYGKGSVDRFERSHPTAATTIATEAIHRRYGGRDKSNTSNRIPPWAALEPPCFARIESRGSRLYTRRVEHVLALVAAYLVGSISFAIIVASSRGIDIRAEGSGNPGTSNVLRVLGRRLAVTVLIGDAFKGVAAAAIGVLAVDQTFGYVTLFVAVIGHSFPIWHGFKGGKSVATAIGGICYLNPPVGLALAVLWIVILQVWKTASVASLAAMLVMVPALAFTGSTTQQLLWASATAVFVIVRHSGNIGRLLDSSERSV